MTLKKMPTDPNYTNNKEKIMNAINEKLQDFAQLVFQYSQEYLVDQNKIDSSNLFKTANIKSSFMRPEIIYPAPYAEAVHNGRDPGSMPPPKSLEKWVRRKLGVRPQNVPNVAFAIAKSIEERGIQPCPFLDQSIQRARNEMKV